MSLVKQIDIETKRMQRTRTLQMINRSDPNPVTERELLSSLQKEDANLGFTERVLRQHLSYLHELECIRAARAEEVWVAMILPRGVDYLDGLGDEIAGVARSL